MLLNIDLNIWPRVDNKYIYITWDHHKYIIIALYKCIKHKLNKYLYIDLHMHHKVTINICT